MVGESCDDPCTGLSHTGRKVWSSFAILELIGHFYCVTAIKHSMSLKEWKVTCEPRDKKDMQAWLAKVLVIKDSVEFVKWNEEKVLSYRIKDSIEFSKQNE